MNKIIKINIQGWFYKKPAFCFESNKGVK